jgi:hypothetical protein
MAFDAGSKMLLVRVVEEESSPGAAPQDMFIYKNDEKYQGDVQYKVVKPDTTTVYVVPSSLKIIYSYLNGWIPITVSFVFTWAITTMLLRQYYQQRVSQQRVGKMPVTLLILLTIPLVLYMIGRYTELYTLFTGIVWRWDDFENAYLFRSIFRVGLIAGSIMFGVAFLVVARKIEAGKIRDYCSNWSNDDEHHTCTFCSTANIWSSRTCTNVAGIIYVVCWVLPFCSSHGSRC